MTHPFSDYKLRLQAQIEIGENALQAAKTPLFRHFPDPIGD